MIRYFFICLAFICLGAVVQQWIPNLGIDFYQARILTVPLLFFCVSLAQSYTGTLIFAIIAGLLWDSENTIAPFSSNTALEPHSVDNLRFGYTIFLFGITGFVLKFFQAITSYRGHLVYSGFIFLTFVLYLLLENLLLLFVRGTATMDHRFFYQIVYTSVFSTLFAPLTLLALRGLWKILNDRRPGVAVGFNKLLEKNN